MKAFTLWKNNSDPNNIKNKNTLVDISITKINYYARPSFKM